MANLTDYLRNYQDVVATDPKLQESLGNSLLSMLGVNNSSNNSLSPMDSLAYILQHKQRSVPTGDWMELTKSIGGDTGKGNINLNNRVPYIHPNGNYSTLESISIGADGKEVLIPTISDTGQLLSQQDAIQQYMKTGKNLGMFNTPEEASKHAIDLERRQQAYYEKGPGRTILDNAFGSYKK